MPRLSRALTNQKTGFQKQFDGFGDMAKHGWEALPRFKIKSFHCVSVLATWSDVLLKQESRNGWTVENQWIQLSSCQCLDRRVAAAASVRAPS